MCSSKRRFSREFDTRIAIARSEQKFRAYKCPHCDGWHLYKSKNLSVIEERMPPGSAEKSHYHEHAEQVFYVLSGIASFEVEGDKLIVMARESICIKPGIVHKIYNLTDQDVEFLVISAPPSEGDRINIEL